MYDSEGLAAGPLPRQTPPADLGSVEYGYEPALSCWAQGRLAPPRARRPATAMRWRSPLPAGGRKDWAENRYDEA
jgi:hypothetical protein